MKCRLFVLALASGLALGSATAAPAGAQMPNHRIILAATEKKHAAHQSRSREPEYIACTKFGCQPTPPGCHPDIGYYPDGSPTGYNIVVCPRSPY